MSKTISFCRRSGGTFSIPLVVSLSIFASSSAFAQLEEIVVTATKRESSLQDAPLAVSAFSGSQLDRQGVNDAIGLNNIVPNLNVATEGARDAVFINIRGISQTERRNAAVRTARRRSRFARDPPSPDRLRTDAGRPPRSPDSTSQGSWSDPPASPAHLNVRSVQPRRPPGHEATEGAQTGSPTRWWVGSPGPPLSTKSGNPEDR